MTPITKELVFVGTPGKDISVCEPQIKMKIVKSARAQTIDQQKTNKG